MNYKECFIGIANEDLQQNETVANKTQFEVEYFENHCNQS